MVQNKKSSFNRRSDKVVFWTGKISTFVSLTLLAIIIFSYLSRPDYLAALTFFPPWAWGFAGLGASFFTALYNKRSMICIVLCWIIFVAVFAEEPKSLLRGYLYSMGDWQNVPEEKRLVIVSLNCAGGNIQAAREVIDCNPDVVLLQESPTEEKIKVFAHDLFNNKAAIAYGPDTVIIARGELEQISLPRPINIFMTQACIRLQSGQQIQVASIRLRPPVAEGNLLSLDCWKKHREDRELRRKQLASVLEQIDYIYKEKPVILGGDFNVSANDGCLRLLCPYLKDMFVQSGVGWGHTAINDIPLFRVDQIWASSHFKSISTVAKKTIYSDHRMVICYMVFQ